MYAKQHIRPTETAMRAAQAKQGGRRHGDTSDAGQDNQKQRERLLPVQSAMLRRSRFASTLVQRIGRDGPAVGRRKLTAPGLTAQAATLVPQRNPRTAKLAAKPHVRSVDCRPNRHP